MLHFIRESIQGWIAWAIVIMLIIPFALWGINAYFGNSGQLSIAAVNGEEISQQAYQQAFFVQRNRMQQMLGAQYDPSLFDARIKQQALEDLIQREVLYQDAQSLGLRVADQSVISTIQNIEAFQDSGKFSQELYLRQLSTQGESAAGFEQRMHRAILTQQLYSGINSSALVTDKETNAILQLQEQKRDIDHFILPISEFKQEADASEEAIKTYYDAHQSEYMTAEKVSVDYVELAADNLTVDTIPSEEELHKIYDERVAQFKEDEQRRTSHILIQIEKDANEEAIKAALNKATDIKAKIDKGEDFAALAKQYSDDPGSAEKGGDLGYYGHNLLDPNYEKTMFSLEEGEVSEPVLSAFGYHIIKLDAIKGGSTKSFDDVKEELISEYKKSATERKFFELSEKLTNLAYEVPDSLSDAAGAVDVEIKTSDLFTRNQGTGIAANPKVRAAAFNTEVLKNHYNSEPLEIGENHVVVLRVKEYQEPAQRPLDEVKVQISQKIIDDKAHDRVKEKGQTLVDQLVNSENPDNVLSELKKEWIKSGEVTRTDTKIDSAIVRKAFKLKPPTEKSASFGAIALASGDFAIIRVNKIITPAVASIEDSKKQALKKNLSGIIGETDFQNTLASLKAAANIVIQQENQ